MPFRPRESSSVGVSQKTKTASNRMASCTHGSGMSDSGSSSYNPRCLHGGSKKTGILQRTRGKRHGTM